MIIRILFAISCTLYSLIGNGQLDSLGCSGVVGDVKYSVLDTDDFQSVNGPCWILMDGRFIASSKLGAMGFSNVPDSRGYFIRVHDTRQSGRIDTDRSFGSPVGQVQQDLIESHDHVAQMRNSNASLENSVDSSNGLRGWDTGAPNTGLQSIDKTKKTGGHETRPKNITLFLYIRIN